VQDTPQSQTTADLLNFFSRKIAGQPNTAERIIPFIQTFRAGLTPENRPIGVFLLLGPTGTGKTRTVEVLAEALHGSAQRYLRIDCGEFQLDHEVAKLIGSPPGYLGHRETVPVLSKQKLAEALTPECDISLVLFDEIEKAAPSLTRLLLGVLDKGRLTLGDNSVVDFNQSLIFLTSNLGAREMMFEMTPSFGFKAADGETRERAELAGKLESIALGAVKRMFSPEFVNRIDAIITYQPLSADSIKKILDHQIDELQQHVNERLGANWFTIEVTDSARELLLSRGVSIQYGARELKRVVYRQLTQPLATMVAENRVLPGSVVTVHADAAAEKLDFDMRRTVAPSTRAAKAAVLIVDDNEELLKYLKLVMHNQGWELMTASSGNAALNLAVKNIVDVALVDYMLPDLDGVAVSRELQQILPSIKIILMTGGGEMSVREESGLGTGVPVLQKPFVVEELLKLVRSRLPKSANEESSSAASSGG
jgi:ATP-dependent Clp protease ATP-binding subunit ClpA/CheY-like chemotaxis protein